MKITVFGAGRVGSAIIKDLAIDRRFEVTAIDMNVEAVKTLESQVPISTIVADLSHLDAIPRLLSDADLVICAVPGSIGFQTLRQIIDAGKDVVDISFFNEDPFLLDELAQTKGVTAVVDCGVAPGLHNIILGYVDTQLDQLYRTACYVGGLPKIRLWPYEYKAVFSPADIIEEYTRPSRYVEYGQMVVRPALSDVELLDLPGVGTLEAFNTDGLRTLIRTMDAPFMIEKTLRYPGHAALMAVFRDSGFFDTTPINVENVTISPRAFTSRLLFDQWSLAEGEEDITVMQIIIEGERLGKKWRYRYDLLDHYDAKTKTSSMARTTGYTCTAIARQVLLGQYDQKGISPPEYVGRTPGCYQALLEAYRERGIVLQETLEESV